MPGYNHRPTCTCGWCLKTGSTSVSSSYSNQNVGRSLTPRVIYREARSTKSHTSQTDEAKTYKTQCWDCGEEVFYHTNGYGDSVLFDSLGRPWEVHSCWEKRINKNSEPQLFDLKLNQGECLIIAGAINKLQKERKAVTQETLAKELGISIDDLSKYYGSYYVILPRSNGKIRLRKGF